MNDVKLKPLFAPEWRKTPYAMTTAKDTEGAIAKIMVKYQVKQYSVINSPGPNGRPAFGVQFILKDNSYLVHFECMDVRGVAFDHLLAQVKRVVYHTLKTALESASVFLPPEKVLFPFLEIPNRGTLFDEMKPFLSQLGKPGTGTLAIKMDPEAGA